MNERKRTTVVSIVVAALALLALLWMFRDEKGASAPVTGLPSGGSSANASSAPYAQGVPPPGANASPPTSAAPSTIVPPAKPEQVMPPPDEGWPYSPETLPLVAVHVPGESMWDDVPSDDLGTFSIRLRPASYFFRAPAPIVVEIEVLDKAKVKQKVSRAEVQLKAATGGKKTPLFLEAVASQAADGVYRATFTLDETQQKSLMGHVMLLGQVQLANGGKSYLIASSCMYTREPDGRITGNYRDEMRDGSLVIAMSLHIDKQGLYQVRGQLFGPQFQPIAESRTTQTLAPGDHRLELRFYGKALFDRGIDGPYRLRYVYLSQAFPEEGYEAIGPIVADAHTTAAYLASKFTSAKYEAPAFEGPNIGADHPSQANKPPPLYAKRPDGPPIGPVSSGPTMPMGADSVTAEQLNKLQEAEAKTSPSGAPSAATAGPTAVGPPKP